MDTTANIITTMGIIANEVYADKGQKYFEDLLNNPDGSKNYQLLIANGTTYKVINHTPTDNQGFNALLLEKLDITGKGSGEYVIAFRGTQETYDIVEDGIVGLNNNSSQFEQAKVWVDKMINDNKINTSKLTLTGHSFSSFPTSTLGMHIKTK